MAKKRTWTATEIADRVKKYRPCMKCRALLWTDRRHRLCKKCGGVADNTPPMGMPHKVALLSGGRLDFLCHALTSIQEAGYGA